MMENSPKYLVRIHCATYNHARFITNALNGFVMQQTNFPFVYTICDDASTDGEQEVIKAFVQEHFDLQDTSIAYEKDEDYGHVTFARHKTNKNCHFAVIYLNENHYSQWKSKAPYVKKWNDQVKYIASCEGDDYWTDPKKLQKQVEYMESHPGCAGCFHERVRCDAEGRIMEGTELPKEIRQVQTWQSLMDVHRRTYTPPTCTVMWRKEVLEDRPEWMNKVKSGGDFMTAFWAAYAHGTVDWVDDIKPSVYRIHAGGIFRGLSQPHQIMLEHMDHQVILEHFSIPKAIRRENHLLWEKETFRAWRLWHGSDSEEIRRALQSLVSYDVASWPALRWRLWGRQVGYWLNQGRWRAWHGLVMGIKRVLPTGMYERGRRRLQKRHSGGRA